MVEQQIISVGSARVTGVRVALPNAPVLMLVGARGAVACGYFKLEVAEKFGHALAIVSGVKTFEEILAGAVKAVSPAALALGVREGMTGAEAAERLA